MIGLLPSLVGLAFASAGTAASAPPAILVPYIKDGHLDPGDYGWMRGAFADASVADKERWRSLLVWQMQCIRDQQHAAAVALKRYGIAATPKPGGMGDGVCGEMGYALPHADEGESWPLFQAAVARARPVAMAVVWSAAIAQANAAPRQPGEGATLVARTMTDQVLRDALSWGRGTIPGAPALDSMAQGVADGIIWRAIGERDHANTAWLKALVARRGWPTIASVGKAGAYSAWLLAQHADDDPVFQYDVLRLMEPLARHGEVERHDYAMLDDRVRLKIFGRQRYATQFICRGGRHVPQPIEDEADLAPRRAAMGLDTLAQNVARMEKSYGPCPPDAVPPAPAKR